jgi:hypothetical protein
MPHEDRSVLGTDLELWQTITAINLHLSGVTLSTYQ